MRNMDVINIKILSLGAPERYAVRRMLTVAQQELQTVNPQLQVIISEVNEAGQIGRYASVLVLPTLVINEKVVCSGRFPTRAEIIVWLREAMNKT